MGWKLERNDMPCFQDCGEALQSSGVILQKYASLTAENWNTQQRLGSFDKVGNCGHSAHMLCEEERLGNVGVEPTAGCFEDAEEVVHSPAKERAKRGFQRTVLHSTGEWRPRFPEGSSEYLNTPTLLFFRIPSICG